MAGSEAKRMALARTRVPLDIDGGAFVFMPEHVHLIVHLRSDDSGVANIASPSKVTVHTSKWDFRGRGFVNKI